MIRIPAVVGSVMCILMLLVSCMKRDMPPSGTGVEGSEGIRWHLTEVGGSPVSLMADDKQPHILLDRKQNQATGFGGCNNFFGSYERDGSSLTFGPVGSTRMACPDPEMSVETDFFKALEQTHQWKLEGHELLFLDGSSQVLARFSKQNES